MDSFIDAWKGFHPHSIPINHRLKHDETDLWLRIHSLPESKRYAQTDQERAIIRHRQHTVARELLGEGGSCWMIGYLYFEHTNADEGEGWQQSHPSHPELWGMTKAQYIPDPEDSDAGYNIFANRTVWQEGVYDTVLDAIADDKMRIMWMSELTGAIFAPYDGGVDMILPSIEDAKTLALRHRGWLSSHPNGFNLAP